jgi:F-type H+-transporting ATPase subunit a
MNPTSEEVAVSGLPISVGLNWILSNVGWRLFSIVTPTFYLFVKMATFSISFVFLMPSSTMLRDPLEQFDVLALPIVGGGLTNLSLLLTLNVLVMGVWFSSYSIQIRNNYDFTLRALYTLVRSVVRENLYVAKQQYFTVLFYLFFTLLLANLVGMIPYSFTITSSFIVTFFLALTYFIALNHLAVVKHG